MTLFRIRVISLLLAMLGLQGYAANSVLGQTKNFSELKTISERRLEIILGRQEVGRKNRVLYDQNLMEIIEQDKELYELLHDRERLIRITEERYREAPPIFMEGANYIERPSPDKLDNLTLLRFYLLTESLKNPATLEEIRSVLIKHLDNTKKLMESADLEGIPKNEYEELSLDEAISLTNKNIDARREISKIKIGGQITYEDGRLKFNVVPSEENKWGVYGFSKEIIEEKDVIATFHTHPFSLDFKKHAGPSPMIDPLDLFIPNDIRTARDSGLWDIVITPYGYFPERNEIGFDTDLYGWDYVINAPRVMDAGPTRISLVEE